MKILDISMTIKPEMMVYKNNKANSPEFTPKFDYTKNEVYETKLTINLHTGTHIDAPLHMIKDGAKLEDYPLEKFITKCKVMDFTNLSKMITYDDIKDKNIYKDDFIIFKTKNSFSDSFENEFVFLEKSAAKFLADIEIKGVGIDSLGIERDQPNHETHKNLLSKGIIILEGLRLKDIVEGDYTLIALPLKIENVEASPLRAILIQS